MEHAEFMTLGDLIRMLSAYDAKTSVLACIEGVILDHSTKPFQVLNAPIKIKAEPLWIPQNGISQMGASGVKEAGKNDN